MKVGIISEGKADQAVIKNILKGTIDLDSSDIQYIQPENFLDETDLNNPNYKMNPSNFSNWELVINECKTRTKINDFFESPLLDDKTLIIQIDTAETYQKNYAVTKPDKEDNPNYVEEVRNVVKNKLETLIGINTYKIIYAICVEETDAWVLTIYRNNKGDTGLINKPKEELENEIKKDKKLSKLKDKKAFQKYDELSKEFSKKKNIKNLRLKNKSLDLFCTDLETKI